MLSDRRPSGSGFGQDPRLADLRFGRRPAGNDHVEP
jgi:hypothetical protein